MGTAFEEALNSVGKNRVPDYITAADTLNMANENKTFLEDAFDVVENIPKFIGVSLISGANQLYNIAPDVGNFFGGDFERVDTAQVIADLDSDLGQFYNENKESADLVGFIASSLVPGLGGVKMLKAGQASLKGALGNGKFGGGMGKALGLLVDNKQTFLNKAISEVATNGSTSSILSGNALKAIGQGAKQNVLEAIAFESAVAATMFNSPILENQDMGDFITNVAFGAGVFGLAATAVDATVIKFSLKNTANTAAKEARPWTFVAGAAEASSPHERIILDLEQAATIPKVPTNLPPERVEFLKQAAETKVTTLNNRIRTNLREVTNGDERIADIMFAAIKGSRPQDATANLFGLADAVRLTGKAKLGDEVDILAKKIASNKATPEEIARYNNIDLATTYVKAWGEDAGKAVTEVPTVTQIVDFLKPGEVIKTGRAGIRAGKKLYKFNTAFNMGKNAAKSKATWDITKSTPLEANARHIWAQELAPFTPSAKNPIFIDVNDIPMMEKILRDTENLADDVMQHVTFVEAGKKIDLTESLFDTLATKKIEIANKLLVTKSKTPYNQEEIAAMVNVKSSALSGELVADGVTEYSKKDFLAMQDHAEEYTKRLVAQGVRKSTDEPVKIWDVPQTIKMSYNTKPFEGIDNHMIEGMTVIKEQQKLYQEANARASANALGKENYDLLEDINSGRVYDGASPSGAGAGFLAAASNNYGTLAASVENIGRSVFGIINRAKERTTDTLNPLLYKLGQNPEAAIEWSILNNRLRSTSVEYGINEAGDALEPVILLRWRQMAKEAQEAGEAIPNRPVIKDVVDDVIPMNTAEVKELAKVHIEMNGARVNKLMGIRAAQGVKGNLSPDAFYPTPVNPRDYPHFAIVIDESVTGGNKSKMLYADNAEDLDSMGRKMKENPHMKVLYKKEAMDYYKAIGQFDYEKSISRNHIDIEAARKGTSAPLLPSTDPKKIADDFLNWNLERESNLVREAVTAKYEVQFEELRRLGDEATNVGTSKFDNSSFFEYAENQVANPYVDYIKTALNISKQAEYPMWVNVNRMADDAISNLYKKIDAVFTKAKNADELAEIDTLMRKAGYKGAMYDPEMEIFANAGVARGALSKVVQKANSIMATIVLRWDTLNAVNNAVSANVLLGAEVKAITRAIERGDKDAVGALSDLMRVKIPGSNETMISGKKMVANAIKAFNTKGPEMQFFRDNGFITRLHDQNAGNLAESFYKGGESVSAWDNRLNKLVEKGRKAGDAGEIITGNRMAEEFNRFVAAHTMKQMTDIAVARKLMTDKEALGYINTFVNRTQGNYLAAQRPMMFQGPVGQAIGLFQTYQFNLIQQMLRHVGEGHAKDSMTLLALQGTIHGMNGMPGFSAINTHLIGNASGNQEHKDLYDATYGLAGKEAGDWLMYGVASNALGLIDPDLKINLYTRGDINPRHVTLIPTDPSSVPIVQSTAKVIGNMIETAKKLGIEGADVSGTLLQGLEHNGISRPLAGLAQVMQGMNNPEQASYSTSKKGNVIAANDFISLANLGRVLGGKPLDEAVAIDATYRYKAYALKDNKRRQLLGEAIKTTMLAGQTPTSDQIDSFITQYVAGGGRQKEFNSWFGQLYKTANLSQANQIQQDLNSPFSQSMQRLMGGEELRDFSN